MISLLKKKVKSKKGAYSMITVMLALIMVMSFTAYSDILRKSFVLNEVQQRLDTAGLNTLNESIDTSRLILEELAIDAEDGVSHSQINQSNFSRKIERKYKEEVYEQIRTNETIKEIQVRRTSVTMSNSSFGTGAGRESVPQITLDALIYLEVASTKDFDLSGSNTQEFYDARSGSNFQVEVVDRKKDGTTALLIRSATPIVYR